MTNAASSIGAERACIAASHHLNMRPRSVVLVFNRSCFDATGALHQYNRMFIGVAAETKFGRL